MKQRRDDYTKKNHQLIDKAIVQWLHHSQWRNTKKHPNTNENLRLKSKSSNLIPQT
jgi:hypothetical protein